VISKQVLLEHLYDYNWEHHSNVIERTFRICGAS